MGRAKNWRIGKQAKRKNVPEFVRHFSHNGPGFRVQYFLRMGQPSGGNAAHFSAAADTPPPTAGFWF